MFVFCGRKRHESRFILKLLGRKAISNLDSVLKSRDITLPSKVCAVTAIVFPVPGTDVRAGQQRRQSTEELMLSTCDAGEDS